MGQRMRDEDIVYGDDCLRGFDAGETPKSVYVRFSGIIRCPAGDYEPPNDRPFKIPQSLAVPCDWFDILDIWEVTYNIWQDPIRSAVSLHNDADGMSYFYDIHVGPIEEGTVYQNDIVACTDATGGRLGIAVVTWSPQATELLESINLAKGNDLFMELFPLADGKLVYKFCRLKDATNIKILYEP